MGTPENDEIQRVFSVVAAFVGGSAATPIHSGYLARMSDPPPGNTVVWRGLRRLVDIQIGAGLATYG